MDTGWKNWTLTLGATVVAGAIATGHGQLVADTAGAVADVAWWLIRPLGPAQ